MNSTLTIPCKHYSGSAFTALACAVRGRCKLAVLLNFFFCILCVVVMLVSSAGFTTAYGATPLQFEDPPVELSPRPGGYDEEDTPPKPAATKQTRTSSPAQASSDDTPPAEAADPNKPPTVYLFDTADMFRKSIANNAPQWERVANEVKKKLLHSPRKAPNFCLLM